MEVSSPQVDIVLPAAEAADEGRCRAMVAAKLGVAESRIQELRLVKRSLDARQRTIKVQLRYEVGLDQSLPAASPLTSEYPTVPPGAPRVVIIGCGPAGLFAALRCLELGCQPVVLERGKDASARRFDLAPILRKGTVIEDSNYCYGEGGAGTFSDGKLYTRAKKRGPVYEVYRTLVAHGAPENILVEAHPHIGSNQLPKVVMAMRQSIRDAGGEVHFGMRVVDLIQRDGRIAGVRTATGDTLEADRVILATGHSARDIYTILSAAKVRLEAKPFAVGVRIEHPQPLIDSVQYHYRYGDPRPAYLPAASYSLATTVKGRSVHSFCMCPGGFIVPAATANDEVVVNGMSLSKRDSPFANSGLVVGIEPEDAVAWTGESGVLAGMQFQQRLERAAKQAGGNGQVAPAQRVVDFLAGRASTELPKTSYFPGVASARLDQLLPEPVALRLQRGLKWFGTQRTGYAGEEALLVGFETRTSSPVRIPRDSETLQHPDLAGLFPCGEGAGYAGGIVSAALDGRRCAEAAAQAVSK